MTWEFHDRYGEPGVERWGEGSPNRRMGMSWPTQDEVILGRRMGRCTGMET